MRQPRETRSFAYLTALICMAGCSFAPDVPSSKGGPVDDIWPSLLTVDALAGLTDGLEDRPPELDEETEELAAKAAALRARAAGLSASVLTDAERQRLADAAAAR